MAAPFGARRRAVGPSEKRRGVYRLLTDLTAAETKFGWEAVEGVLNSVANLKQDIARLGISIKRSENKKGYDRYIDVHGPSVTVLVHRLDADGQRRFGCIETERVYRSRLPEAVFPPDPKRSYIRRLCEDRLWPKLMEGPGTICTEFVGGMVDPEDFKGYEKLPAAQALELATEAAASREAEEELGAVIKVEHVFVDCVCPDPAHTLHPQSIAIGRWVADTKQRLGETEAPKKGRWYTLAELIERMHDNRIDDGRVGNALFRGGFLVPAAG